MSYQSIILVQDETLSWPYPAIPNLITIGDINDITVEAADLSITLPAANNVGTGTTIIFNNVTPSSVTDYGFDLLNNVGDPIYPFVSAGDILSIYLTDNSTPAGQWTVIPLVKDGTGITSLTAVSSSSGITITNPTVNTSNGTITFNLDPGLQNLTQIGSIGLSVITALTPLTWNTVQLSGSSDNTNNILIPNGSGTTGNISIDLNPIVTNLTALNVGNFNFSGSSCTATSGSNLNFSTGTGNTITINQVDIEASGDITTTGNLEVEDITVNGSISSPAVASAWVRFTDNGHDSDNITVIDSYNIAPQHSLLPGVTGTQGSYAITYAAALNDCNYAISATLFRGTETIAPLLVYPTSPINIHNMNIMTVDTLGNLLPVRDGISVIIFGSQVQ